MKSEEWRVGFNSAESKQLKRIGMVNFSFRVCVYARRQITRRQNNSYFDCGASRIASVAGMGSLSVAVAQNYLHMQMH